MQVLDCDKIPEKLVPFILRNRDKTFLLNFPHGLGDVIMWYPIYEKIKNTCKGARIDLKLKNTNKELGLDTFDSSINYDFQINIKYWSSDAHYPKTKNQLCLELEIGLDAPKELYTTKIKSFASPFVTLGFTSNCEPERYGCPKDIAKHIYEGVIEAGFIPLSLEFITSSYVQLPRDYSSFIGNSTRDCAVNMRNLIGSIQRSYAFIGVTSGPMWVALSCLGPTRCMCLDCRREESWKVIPLDKMRFTYQGDVNKEYVVKWLKSLQAVDQI